MDLTCPKCGSAYDAEQAGGLCPACLASVAAHPTGSPIEEAPLQPGTVFHGLEILEIVGRGGMGVVYKARHPHLNRFVAVKVLPRKLAEDADFRERFLREARALAGLGHPNIVGIYDFGFEGDLTFLVMEFVDGVNLRSVLQDRRLTPSEALAIVPQLCDALQYAHGEGLVHRDIKPENILMDRKGRVKIADFGLAKIVGGPTTSITQSNAVMGTPHYMAPEQVENPKEVDHRADIYSIGVVFYEILTGELPIGRFEMPSRKVQVDVRLDDVVLKTLEKAPDRRYQHASELKEDVTRITAGAAAPGKGAIMKSVAVAAWLGVVLQIVILAAVFTTRPRTSGSSTADQATQLRTQLVDARKQLLEVAQKPPDLTAYRVAQQNCDRIEESLARLEGRAPRYERPQDYEPPVKEVKLAPPPLPLEHLMMTEQEMPAGVKWEAASHRVLLDQMSYIENPDGSNFHVDRDMIMRQYAFHLHGVTLLAIEVSALEHVAYVTTKLRGTIEGRSVSIFEKDRLIVALWIVRGSQYPTSESLHQVILKKVRAKIGS